MWYVFIDGGAVQIGLNNGRRMICFGEDILRGNGDMRDTETPLKVCMFGAKAGYRKDG